MPGRNRFLILDPEGYVVQIVIGSDVELEFGWDIVELTDEIAFVNDGWRRVDGQWIAPPRYPIEPDPEPVEPTE